MALFQKNRAMLITVNPVLVGFLCVGRRGSFLPLTRSIIDQEVYTISINPAAPIPVPIHMVTIPYLWLCRFIP